MVVETEDRRPYVARRSLVDMAKPLRFVEEFRPT